MNNWESCKKYLTEKVLGECWHESKNSRAVGKVKPSGGITIQTCYKCKAVMSDTYHGVNENRTFDNVKDLHDLYSAIYKQDKWSDFIDWVDEAYYFPLEQNGDGHAWLFCLNGTSDNFNARCQMVAEWHGWKEEG